MKNETGDEGDDRGAKMQEGGEDTEGPISRLSGERISTESETVRLIALVGLYCPIVSRI